MSELISLPSLKSSIDIKKLDEYSLDFLKLELKDFSVINKISTFHEARQKEFLLGRYSSKINFNHNFHYELRDLNIGEHREPVWPNGFIGSLSHSRTYVVSALAKNDSIEYLGIDIEYIGRVGTGVAQKILIDKDVTNADGLTTDQVLTLIFSAKEAFYKALFPKYGRFFGFESAYISNISFSNKSFNLSLSVDLDEYFTMERFNNIEGKFIIYDSHIITLIEIPSLD